MRLKISADKNQFYSIPSCDRYLIKSHVAWIKFLDILLLHIFKSLNVRSSDDFSISELWFIECQSWDVLRETFPIRDIGAPNSGYAFNAVNHRPKFIVRVSFEQPHNFCSVKRGEWDARRDRFLVSNYRVNKCNIMRIADSRYIINDTVKKTQYINNYVNNIDENSFW